MVFIKKILLLGGGVSSEHEVSLKSLENVFDNLDRNKYKVNVCLITKNNEHLIGDDLDLSKMTKVNLSAEVKKYDIVFPVLHGENGEDGKIQSFLEMLDVCYVGCNSYTSFVAMDKVLTKLLLEKNGIKQVKYLLCYRNENINDLDIKIRQTVKYPSILKASSLGSSIGVYFINNKEELEKYYNLCSEFSQKILIEEYIEGLELEIGIIGNNKKVFVSPIGEVKKAGLIYDYESKYEKNDTKIIIPADISKKNIDTIKTMALKIYEILDVTSLSRLDFFLDEKSGEVYFNEINTMPGFTIHSMFSLLFNYMNITTRELLDMLINIACDNYNKNKL